MKKDQITQAEALRKKKSMRITAAIHVGVLLLAFLPFMEIIPENPFQQPLMIEFKASGSSHAGAKKSSKPKAAKTFTPKEAKAPVTPKVKPLPTPPVKTTVNQEPAIPKVKEVNVKTPEITPEPLPEPEEVEEVEEVVEEPVEEITEEVAEVAEEVSEDGFGEGGQGDDVEGTAATDGDGEGLADEGDGTDAEGDGGEGDGDGMFEGDGVLTRPIIKRPDLASIVQQKGTLAVRVCVNRQGKVTYVEYDEENSSIKDKELVRKALDASIYYRFKRDNSAPSRECGRLTFIIDFIDNRKKKD